LANPLSGERQTPAHIAQDKQLPNEGIHWVDWVPAKVRTRVEAMFAEIPYKKQARVFTPFRRIVTPAQHNRLAATLRKTIVARHDSLLTMRLIRKDAETDAKIAELDAALNALNRLPDDSPVPRDWRKLVPAVTVETQNGSL
jgi:hypothetical protein